MAENACEDIVKDLMAINLIQFSCREPFYRSGGDYGVEAWYEQYYLTSEGMEMAIQYENLHKL